MKAIVGTMGIDKSAKFDKTMQDKIGIGLIKHKQPYAWDYISKKHNDRTGAMKALAGEWASLPDPATGRSMYGGGNASSHSVEQVAAALDGARGGAPLVSDNPDIMSQMNSDIASGGLTGGTSDTGGTSNTGTQKIAQTPEAKQNIAFQALQDAIMQTRKVIGNDGVLKTTTETADAKVKAEDAEEVKTGEKMAAATAVASAVSRKSAQNASSAAGSGGGGTKVIVPTNNKPEILQFLPTFGLFGASV
jgi:hypothetical protein